MAWDVRIVVTSTNPTKVEATRIAAEEVLGTEVEIETVEVVSGVSEMPMSKEECRRGARVRVENGLRLFPGSITVGHEGGVVEVHGDWYLFGATYASDGRRHSWGGETLVYMPMEIVERLKGGLVELGDVIDELTRESGTKRRGGAIAYLSKNRITRQELFVLPAKQALVRWLI